MKKHFEWLDPWGSTEGESEEYRQTFAKQLEIETSPGHPLNGLPVKLIGRGDGDDCLFEILDGSGRVAEVHLVWQGTQNAPWPSSNICSNIEEWREQRMIPAHNEWN